MSHSYQIGDLTRYPGFPELLRIDSLAGDAARVSWQSPDGDRHRLTVSPAQLVPAEYGQLINLFVDRLELLDFPLPRTTA